MKIADLFVSIGITGGNVAVKSLNSVEKGLVEISTQALKATAAVFGLFYGLERLTAPSNQFGTNLMNFGNRTGLDPETMQRWMFAARKAGAANEDVTASFESMQDKITAMKQQRGDAPEGLKLLAPIIAKNKTDINDMVGLAKDYVEFIQTVKQKGGKLSDVKFVGESLGLTEGFQNAAFKDVLNDKNFKGAGVINKNGLKALDNLRNQWQEISQDFFLEIAKLNIKHMPKLLPEIKEFIHSFLDFVDSLSTLIEKYDLIEKTGGVLQGLSILFDTFADKKLNQKQIDNSFYGQIKKMVDDNVRSGKWKAGHNIIKPDTNVNINAPITQTFHGPTDPIKTGEATKDATKQLYPAWLNPTILQNN